MTGFLVVVATLVFALLLVGIAKLADVVRGVQKEDKWAGWYGGKTNDVSQTLGYKAGEYDSMDDHGNRDMDGGLR